MKKFMDDDFLLSNETAKTLYHAYAKEMPICDYHCHLNPKEIYEDKKFKSITEAWLAGDHYKWRILRASGVSEDYITGNQPDYEKFLKYAEVMPYTIGNPIYHWTHLELKRYFGIHETLDKNSAKRIFDACNQKLETLTARKLIDASNVKFICTTDDPLDTLEYHEKLAKETLSFRVLPAFRPDKAINIELDWFVDWVLKLAEITKRKITGLAEFKEALIERIEHFHKNGCRLSDHALDVVYYEAASEEEVGRIFKKGLKKEQLSLSELKQYKGYMMVFFGKEYAKRNWAQQYHIGALRNVSKRTFMTLGPDTGYDAINDTVYAKDLAGLLSALDVDNELPRTILYTLNPRDNELLAVMSGCFQGNGIKGKIQFGSGWWFNDQLDGMNKQMEALSQMGLLSAFVGMLTDSRSFLSYTRHEYFRRLLCDRLGKLIENGEYPNDLETVGQIVKDICYNNIIRYLNF